MQRDALRAVEHLAGAHHSGVIDAIERIAHHDMHQLIDEQLRRSRKALLYQVGISRFQCLVPDQMVAEREQNLPVLARVGIGNRGDIGGRHFHARIVEQRRVQRFLDGAGLRRRNHLGPRHVDFEKIVGQQQPAAFVAVEQMMAAGNPEVLHLLSRPAMPIRSTVSTGASSSPVTSRNENARSGFGPLRGFKVRNAS